MLWWKWSQRGRAAGAVSFPPTPGHERSAAAARAGFVIGWFAAYIRGMPSKPIELPSEVAKAFVRDMRAFFAADSIG